MPKLKSLVQFVGKWQLERTIIDHRNDLNGQMSGSAHFTPLDADALKYEEEGQLVYGAQPAMFATRRYVWRSSTASKLTNAEQNSAVKVGVEFEDGRPFHTILLDRSMPDDIHHCDPDVYHVSYDFTRWPEWQSVWRVVGPAKDYRMTSVYSRA